MFGKLLRSAFGSRARSAAHESAQRAWAAYARGEIDTAAAELERALRNEPGNWLYAASLADTRLLQQREDDALPLYASAFPDLAREVDARSEAPGAWKKAHPDWLDRWRRVTLPQAPRRSHDPVPVTEACASYLLNWALVLMRRRRVTGATLLLERAVEAAPGLGYAHALLTLIHTLNHDWTAALEAGLRARGTKTDLFTDSTELCIAAARVALGHDLRDASASLDWSAFEEDCDDAHLSPLPPVEGLTLPTGAGPIYFIACDPVYLTRHALALACSIALRCTSGAVHLHLFSPDADAWNAIRRLQDAVRPLPVSASAEAVAFDDYSGLPRYCAYARFVRLYQALQGTERQLVMLDADSLVRGDLSAALSGAGDIALAQAEHEPPWHRYLAGFCAVRRTPASLAFLRKVSAPIAVNLANGRASRFLDQIVLYAAAERLAAGTRIDHLPVGRFCDTLFNAEALVWSVTQDKEADSRYSEDRRAVLARYPEIALLAAR